MTPTTTRRPRAHSAERRADQWFLAYYLADVVTGSRGPASVLAMGTRMGLRPLPVEKTIKRWRSRFNWVARADELDIQRAQAAAAAVREDLFADDEQDARVGTALVELGLLGIQKLRTGDGGPDLSGSEIAALVREGIKIRRLAAGRATERVEILRSVWEQQAELVIGLFAEAAEAGLALVDEPELRERLKNGMAAVFIDGFRRMVRESAAAWGVETRLIEERES